MPDISMCANELCPSKEKCYRFMAVTNSLWQSFNDYKVAKGKKKCESFKKILKEYRVRTN